MPATVCHAKFCMDVYEKVKDKRIASTDLVKLRMFGQNTDPFMFYNIESLKPGKKIRDFQYYFHTNKSRSFFINLCNFIKKENLYNNSDILTFLYGFICHYALDSITHPFIIYKTGEMDKKDPNTYKYNCKHAYMETYIDNMIIKKNLNTNPSSFRLDKYCFDLTPFSNELNRVIDYSFEKTFGIKEMSSIYYLSLKQMKSFLRKYRYDSLGFKKNLYKTIDIFTPKYIFKFSCLSYHYFKDDNNYLNLSHNIWYNPINPSIKSTKSFYDLYNDAVENATYIIHKVNEFFSNKNISLESVFTNKSYLTGLDCKEKIKYKKFEF